MLRSAATTETAKGGKTKLRKGHNLAHRLQKNKQDCLRFLEYTKIPYSNNAAESDITMVKLRQKISGDFRTEVVAQEFLTMHSVIQSCGKQGWRVIETLAHPHPLQLTENLRL